MMRFQVLALGALLVASAAPVRADQASPAPAASDLATFSDRSITFTAPPGFTKVPLGSPDNSSGNPVMIALFVKNRGAANQRMIQIVVEDTDNDLGSFETAHESELRKEVDSTFVDKKIKTTLSNGMPAIWLKISQGDQIGQFTRRYEYVVIDLKRGITASYVGRQGDFDDKEAQAALAGLVVVAYPHDR